MMSGLNFLKFAPAGLMLLVGCGQYQYSPLSSYNNKWKGQLSLDNGYQSDIEAQIFHTGLDDANYLNSKRLSRDIYWQVDEITTGRSIAGFGSSNHWDTRDLNEDGFSPIDKREFVEFRATKSVFELGSEPRASEEWTEKEQAYRENIDEFNADLGAVAACENSDPTIQFTGERIGDRIEGVVFYVDYLPCDSKIKRGHKKRLGAFSLEIIADEAGSIGENSAETDGFKFVTVQEHDRRSYRAYIK